MRLQGQPQVGQLFQPGGGGYFVPTIPPTPTAAGYYGQPQMRPSGRWSQQMPRAPMIPANPQTTGTLFFT
jgi:hypothetical protein